MTGKLEDARLPGLFVEPGIRFRGYITGRRTDLRSDRGTKGRMNRRTDGRSDGKTDAQSNGRTDTHSYLDELTHVKDEEREQTALRSL